MWRFWNKYALVHFRGSYLEVDLDDMRAANRILDVIGCDGGVTNAFTDHAVRIALFGGFANVGFLVGNGSWDFEPESNDVGERGH